MRMYSLCMNYIITFVKTFLLGIVLVFFTGCAGDEIIGKKTMVAIVKDMFLADQYIEMNPQLRAQTDSLTVYPSIVAKYGYTMDDYSNSLSYYLQKDDSYNQILKKAQKELEERVDIMEVEIERLQRIRRGPEKWWALDSVRNGSVGELMFEPVMRGVRWIVLPGEKLEKWQLGDSAIVDIPQNAQWWRNNLEIPLEREHFSFFYKDYGKDLADSTTVVKNIKVEKDKKDLLEKIPDETPQQRALRIRSSMRSDKQNTNIITEEIVEEVELP